MHFLFGCSRCCFLGFIYLLSHCHILLLPIFEGVWSCGLAGKSIHSMGDRLRIQKWWSYVNVPYHILGHMNCGDIPWNLGLIYIYRLLPIWDWYLQSIGSWVMAIDPFCRWFSNETPPFRGDFPTCHVWLAEGRFFFVSSNGTFLEELLDREFAMEVPILGDPLGGEKLALMIFFQSQCR